MDSNLSESRLVPLNPYRSERIHSASWLFTFVIIYPFHCDFNWIGLRIKEKFFTWNDIVVILSDVSFESKFFHLFEFLFRETSIYADFPAKDHQRKTILRHFVIYVEIKRKFSVMLTFGIFQPELMHR